MKIEIDYSGSLAACKVNGKPFNECDVNEQVFAMDAFRTIIKDWNRERSISSRRTPKTANLDPHVRKDKNDNQN